MNRSRSFFLLAAFCFNLTICQIASAAAFTNGSFETTTIVSNPPLNILNPPGDTRIVGWNYRSPSNSVDLHLPSPGFGIFAADGDRWVLFGGNSTSGGILEQSFDTVIGNNYDFRFQTTITQWPGGPTPAQSIGVDFFDTVLNLLPGGGTQNVLSQSNGVWLLSSVFSFTATTTTSTIRFTDTSNATVAAFINFGLDGVVLTETTPTANGIPEPSTLAFAASALVVLGMYRTFGRARQ